MIFQGAYFTKAIHIRVHVIRADIANCTEPKLASALYLINANVTILNNSKNNLIILMLINSQDITDAYRYMLQCACTTNDSLQ